MADAYSALPVIFEKHLSTDKPSDAAASGCTENGESYLALVEGGFDLGVLNHEISHVADYIFEYIGEDKAGSESRAYLVQAISDGVSRAFKKFQLNPTF